MLPPEHLHLHPTEWKVEVRDNRSLLHEEPTSARSATRFFEDLFNVDLTTRTTTGVGEDANVF